MRRNTGNWIARIFSIATAGATPMLDGCNAERPLDYCVEPAQAATDLGTRDLARAPDLAQPDDNPPPPMTIRRPFLVGGSLRAAAAARRDDWAEPMAASELDGATRRALAEAWLKDALEEHASVAAFARFSMQALAVGAPPEIVADSQRASLDEIRHARLFFGLARGHGAAAAGPGRLSLEGAIDPVSLPELAALTAQEGCVGETLGALLVERQAQVAGGALARALARVARDEQRHSVLAWRFVAWARAVGGLPVADAVADAIWATVEQTRRMPVVPPAVDLEAWHAHGRVSCAEARQIAETGIVQIVLPALEALRGRGSLAFDGIDVILMS